MPIPVQAVGIGMILSFIFLEVTGLSAGGLIVPGYFAYFWDRPQYMIIMFFVALLCYLIVMILSNFIIIYSQRRFMTAVLSSYLLTWFFSTQLIFYIPFELEIRIIGFIIPGLIANQMIKQGIIKTVFVTLFISATTRLILLLTL